jgi:hypothetical protein
VWVGRIGLQWDCCRIQLQLRAFHPMSSKRRLVNSPASLIEIVCYSPWRRNLRTVGGQERACKSGGGKEGATNLWIWCRIVARLTDRFLWLGRIDPGPCSDKPSQPLHAELAHLYDVLREPSSGASDWYLRCAAAALDGCSGCKLATQEMQPVTQEQPRHLRGPESKHRSSPWLEIITLA